MHEQADTSASSSCVGHLTSLPKNVNIGLFELSESRKRYLKSKIVLSSLMDITNTPSVPSTTVTKIKKVLLFGDISGYLEFPRIPDDVSANDKLILGIIKNARFGENEKLSPEEKHMLDSSLTESIYKKNQSTLDIFDINPQNKSRENALREMKGLQHSLRSICESCSLKSVKREHGEIVGDIHMCYEVLNALYKLLETIVDAEVDIVHPVAFSTSHLSQLQLKGLLSGSRVMLSSLESEFYSSEGAEALRVIGDMQKEEKRRKKAELISLRGEVAEYEKLMGEGFGGLLEEYSLVEKSLKEKQGFLEEFLKKSTFPS